MREDVMTKTILNTIITFVVSGMLGYCISIIKDYKKKLKSKEENEKVQNEALLNMIQSNLTNTYFVYSEMGKIPDYMFKNWNNLFDIYQKLGGNDYCHTLKQKMEKWEIVHTDIL